LSVGVAGVPLGAELSRGRGEAKKLVQIRILLTWGGC
jgi:hypothetical protein